MDPESANLVFASSSLPNSCEMNGCGVMKLQFLAQGPDPQVVVNADPNVK